MESIIFDWPFCKENEEETEEEVGEEEEDRKGREGKRREGIKRKNFKNVFKSNCSSCDYNL